MNAAHRTGVMESCSLVKKTILRSDIHADVLMDGDLISSSLTEHSPAPKTNAIAKTERQRTVAIAQTHMRIIPDRLCRTIVKRVIPTSKELQEMTVSRNAKYSPAPAKMEIQRFGSEVIGSMVMPVPQTPRSHVEDVMPDISWQTTELAKM
jgi:hypothetical protein